MIQHGWPSTVYDFHKIIDQLAEPSDPNAPAFHVIAPSLPGYGWSDIPTRMGYGPAAIADMWVELMSASATTSSSITEAIGEPPSEDSSPSAIPIASPESI